MDIRPATPADLPRLQAFSDRFNRPGSSTFASDFFQWQYADAAQLAGRPETGTLDWVQAAFAADGSVQGYCSASPMRATFAGGEIPGMWLQEWFVDPAASGVGLHLLTKALGKAPMVAVAGGTVDTMNVFLRLTPNAVWFEYSRLVAILSPVACLPLLAEGGHPRSAALLTALRPLVKPGNGIHESEVGRFGAETDQAWQDMRDHCLLAGMRDANGMNWRYADHPRFSYGRAAYTGSAGTAVLIWRMETVGGLEPETRVARLCEAIGSPEAITEAIPHLLHRLAAEGAALCDFFSTHGVTLDALVAGGMHPMVSTPYSDLARLFSPLYFDMRRTINGACFLRGEAISRFRRPHGFLFTKGDGNQDRPNP
jgi:hypothetical protein